MHQFRVGQLYNPNRTRWEEGVHYSYRAHHHELLVFFTDPTEHEIEAIRTGPVDLAFYAQSDPAILVFLYKFATTEWSDAPFSLRRVHPSERFEPPTALNGDSPLLHVILVNARNGVLLAYRLRSLDTTFAEALHAAICDEYQHHQVYRYEADLARLYKRYETPQLLAKAVRETPPLLGRPARSSSRVRV